MTEGTYVLHRSAVDVTRQLSWHNRRRVAVPTVRDKDDKPVYVRGDALRFDQPLPDDDRPVRIKASRVNRLFTAGGFLSVVGGALTALGAAAQSTPSNHAADLAPTGIAALVVGGTAAIVGVIMAIEGAYSAPQEIHTYNPRFIYLDRPATATAAPPANSMAAAPAPFSF